MDIVLLCCEVEGDTLTAKWVQIDPSKIDNILDTEQALVQPKTQDGMTVVVRVPSNLSPVFTDVRFPIIPVAGDR
jgi:hypothetical protein